MLPITFKARWKYPYMQRIIRFFGNSRGRVKINHRFHELTRKKVKIRENPCNLWWKFASRDTYHGNSQRANNQNLSLASGGRMLLPGNGPTSSMLTLLQLITNLFSEQTPGWLHLKMTTGGIFSKSGGKSWGAAKISHELHEFSSLFRVNSWRLFRISHGWAKINRKSFGDSGQVARIHAKKNKKISAIYA